MKDQHSKVWKDATTVTTVHSDECSSESLLPEAITARVVKPSKRSSAGLRFGLDPEGNLIVASLARGGLMEREGSLKAGMRVLQINGVAMKAHTTKALSTLQNGHQEVEVIAQATRDSMLLEEIAQEKKRKKQQLAVKRVQYVFDRVPECVSRTLVSVLVKKQKQTTFYTSN